MLPSILLMVLPTSAREPRQARKGATVAVNRRVAGPLFSKRFVSIEPRALSAQ